MDIKFIIYSVRIYENYSYQIKHCAKTKMKNYENPRKQCMIFVMKIGGAASVKYKYIP